MACIWVTSLVRRVTREPVENRSVCSKLRSMTRRKQSFRTSLENFWLATVLNTPHRMPQQAPRTTRPIIRAPRLMTSPRSPTPLLWRPSTPSSTMRLMRLGCMRSMVTSPIMANWAKRQRRR